MVGRYFRRFGDTRLTGCQGVVAHCLHLCSNPGLVRTRMGLERVGVGQELLDLPLDDVEDEGCLAFLGLPFEKVAQERVDVFDDEHLALTRRELDVRGDARSLEGCDDVAFATVATTSAEGTSGSSEENSFGGLGVRPSTPASSDDQGLEHECARVVEDCLDEGFDLMDVSCRMVCHYYPFESENTSCEAVQL